MDLVERMSSTKTTDYYLNDITKSLKEGNIHKLIQTLRHLPPSNYKDGEKFAKVIVLTENNQNKDAVKILKTFSKKGLWKAEKYYHEIYKNHPILKESDSTKSGDVQFQTMKEKRTSKLQKKEEEDEKIYEAIKEIGQTREKAALPGVNHVEQTVEEIHKGVQQAHVAIDDSFSHLQAMINNMTTQSSSTLKDMKKNMQHLQEAVVSVQQQMRSNTEAINTGVTHLLHETDDLRTDVQNSEEFNEYVYYRVFSIVARAIGSEKGKWLTLLRLLLDEYPDVFIQQIIGEIQREHPSETDMTYDCLTRWKIYKHSSTDRLPTLTRAISKMGFRYVIKDINDILNQYNINTESKVSATIDDQVLKELGKQVGSDYLTIAEHLDISPTKMAKLEEKHSEAEVRHFEMLAEWRDGQAGYTTTAVAKLTEAFKQSKRADLVEQLASVAQHMTLPTTADTIYDMYLTPISIYQNKPNEK